MHAADIMQVSLHRKDWDEDLHMNLENTLAHCVAGHFPVKLEALPEGTVIHAHVPVYQVGA